MYIYICIYTPTPNEKQSPCFTAEAPPVPGSFTEDAEMQEEPRDSSVPGTVREPVYLEDQGT